MTLSADLFFHPRHAGEVPGPLPPALDFHQSLERLLCLTRLGTGTCLAVARNGGAVVATAAFEQAGDRWFLWKGPAGDSPDATMLAALLRAATPLERVTLVLDPAWDFGDVLREQGYREEGLFRTLLVPAEGGPDAILARMRGAARRGVKHALAAGVRFSDDPAHLPGFYPVYAANMTAAASPDFAAEHELAALLALPEVHLFTALLGDRVIAGSVCFRHRHAVEARYVATDAEHRAIAPLHFVHFETLAWAGRGGLRWLDLSGLATGDTDPKLANINRFKESFGGTPHDYPVHARG